MIPSTSPLLRLPWELRQQIWKLFQPSEKDLEVDMCNYVARYCNALYVNQICSVSSHGTSTVPNDLRPLLYVNRQVSMETLALPQARWTLNFYTSRCMDDLLNRVTERQLKLI